MCCKFPAFAMTMVARFSNCRIFQSLICLKCSSVTLDFFLCMYYKLCVYLPHRHKLLIYPTNTKHGRPFNLLLDWTTKTGKYFCCCYGSICLKSLSQACNDILLRSGIEPKFANFAVVNLRSNPLRCTALVARISALSVFSKYATARYASVSIEQAILRLLFDS